MPLFVKAGSILPIGPAIEYTGQKPDAPITLYVYADRSGDFELYEDDGVTYGYERGQFSRIPIRWDDKAGVLPIAGPAAGLTDFDAGAELSLDYDGRAVQARRPRGAG